MTPQAERCSDRVLMKPTEIVISLWYQASLRVFDSGAPPTDADLKKKKKKDRPTALHILTKT